MCSLYMYLVACNIRLQAPSPAYTLNIGSRIYIDNNISIRQRYAATMKSFYNTDVIESNMADVHAVASEVNSWINNITDGHIEKMINDGKLRSTSISIESCLMCRLSEPDF